jgi:hypothetical protein
MLVMSIKYNTPIKDVINLCNKKAYAIEDSHKDYKGPGLYLLEFDDKGIKVGLAKNIKKRLEAYRSPWVKKVIQWHIFKVANPGAIELLIKRTFREHTHNSPEYFVGIELNTLIQFVKSNEHYSTPKPKVSKRALVQSLVNSIT